MVYTPENGITLDMLRRDVRFLKTRYALDPEGKSEGRLVIRYVLSDHPFPKCAKAMVICRNESSSNVYTTEMITKMLQEEGGKLFDARSASLGHTLQGGIPSPMDRARAARLSLKCMAFLEQYHEKIMKSANGHKHRHAPPESAAIITIQTSSVKMVPVQEMVQHADMVNRRGKDAWWSGAKDLEEQLVGKPQFLGIHKELHLTGFSKM